VGEDEEASENSPPDDDISGAPEPTTTPSELPVDGISPDQAPPNPVPSVEGDAAVGSPLSSVGALVVVQPPAPRGRAGTLAAAFVWLIERVRLLSQSRLERLLQEEDTSWKADNEEIRSLICLFRAKHEELRERAKGEHGRGFILLLLSLVGLVATGLLVFLAWDSVQNHPDGSWHVLASSSGAILFLLGATTLCFKAADRFFVRAKGFADDADETRRFEAAVRLALFGLRNDKNAAGAMLAVVWKLLEPKRPSADGPLDLSAMPELGKLLTDAATKATEVAATTISRR
jgi:hypothetical protein